MLHRNPGNQLTLFGQRVNRSRLNWINTFFFFFLAFCNGSVNQHHHNLGDDLDTFSEKLFGGLGLLSLWFYLVINKNQIRNCCGGRRALEQHNHPQDLPNTVIFVHAPAPVEEKFSSLTLTNCIARSKRIHEKLEELNKINVSESKDASSEKIPEEFICPVLLRPMECPVVASDGVTYDYEGVTPVISTTKISPMTRERLSNALNPLPKLQDQIENWVNKKISEKRKNKNQLGDEAVHDVIRAKYN